MIMGARHHGKEMNTTELHKKDIWITAKQIEFAQFQHICIINCQNKAMSAICLLQVVIVHFGDGLHINSEKLYQAVLTGHAHPSVALQIWIE